MSWEQKRIAELERELRDVSVALRVVVAAAGGSVEVPEALIVNPPEELHVYERIETFSSVFEVQSPVTRNDP